MDHDSDASDIQLVTYRRGTNTSADAEAKDPGASQHRKRSRRYGATANDTMEKGGYLSGEMMQESLPSIRAELANSMRYREAREKDDQKESTPLLTDSGMHEAESESREDDLSDYDSVGSKSKRITMMMLW